MNNSTKKSLFQVIKQAGSYLMEHRTFAGAYTAYAIGSSYVLGPTGLGFALLPIVGYQIQKKETDARINISNAIAGIWIFGSIAALLLRPSSIISVDYDSLVEKVGRGENFVEEKVTIKPNPLFSWNLNSKTLSTRMTVTKRDGPFITASIQTSKDGKPYDKGMEAVVIPTSPSGKVPAVFAYIPQ